MTPKTKKMVYPQILSRITRLDKMNRVKKDNRYAKKYLEGLFKQIKHIRINSDNPTADRLLLDEILADALTLDELNEMEQGR